MGPHLKRMASPRTWNVKRKGEKFITKLTPGPHNSDLGMPFGVLLKEILGKAASSTEAKRIMNSNEIKIDGTSRKDVRFPVGLFDTIEFIGTGECFRVILNKGGKIDLAKISREEALLKPCKIIGKSMVKGKIQLNLYDGKNILVGNNGHKVGDTVLIRLPGQAVSKHLKLGKKSAIFLTGGRHIGEVGNVEDISKNRIVYKNEQSNIIETSKKYAFVVGEDKPLITVK